MRAGSDRQTDTYCRRQVEGKASRARARGRATLLLPLGKTRGEKRQSMGRARERAECSADGAGGARYLSLLCFMKLGPCLRNSVVSPKSGHPIVPGGRPRRRLYRSSFHRSSRLLASTTPSTASRSNSSAISLCLSFSLVRVLLPTGRARRGEEWWWWCSNSPTPSTAEQGGGVCFGCCCTGCRASLYIGHRHTHTRSPWRDQELFFLSLLFVTRCLSIFLFLQFSQTLIQRRS